MIADGNFGVRLIEIDSRVLFCLPVWVVGQVINHTHTRIQGTDTHMH